MDRRELSAAFFATVAGAALLPRKAQAQSCTAPCYPRTQAEDNAGVTPTHYEYPPGNVFRYGAVGDGLAYDHAAFAQAIAANSLVTVPDPPSFYVFNQSVTLRSGVTIIGSNRSTTIIKPATTLPNLTALFQAPAYVTNVTIERLGFVMPNVGQNAVGLWFYQARQCVVRECYFVGPSGPSPDHNAIVINPGTGSNVYSGDFVIENNYIANVKYGISMSGSCTTINIINNNLTVGGGIQYGSCAIVTTAASSGVLIQGNCLQGWNYGVLSYGGYLRQVGNYFEGNTTDWFWDLGVGNTGIWNSSIGDVNPSVAGLNSYPANKGCIVLGQGWVVH